ncbi:MAG: lipopolysaccharide biosynthesis protein [Gammaproteobacteria bacterium]|nr:lipopolysaccharide biosynthesis protein [Gammaproteobacteria bacterium]
MEEANSLNTNYGAVIKRRLPLSLMIVFGLATVTLALALGLPSRYKSRAVVLIEAQEIPEDLVRSLVTSYADQRIQVIAQRVLTNNNLSSIIDKYHLYAESRKRNPLEEVLEQMRKDITVKPISAEVGDPKLGHSVQATIAIELAYENKAPDVAQRVANEVVSLFLNENLKQRTKTSEETLNFLSSESEKLRNQVADLETKLAAFKEKNVEQLPELANLNMELMNRTETDVTQIDSQIRSLEQQRVYLESELAQQKPSTSLYSETGERILGPADRLKVLESEFVTVASRYGAEHPDVIAKRKAIESLRAQTGSTNKSAELALKLSKAQTGLAEANRKYSSDHPDIKRLNREIDSLQAELASASKMAPPVKSNAPPDNPAFIQLQARLEATNGDIRALQEQRAGLKAKLSNIEARITRAPQVEREYRMLTRDYETAQRKYQEVVAKRQEAELATNLENKQQGEKFTLIEPPVIPEEPSKPNRLAIGLLGGLLSIAGGVGTGALAESLDGRIYGRMGVTRLLGVPPLAVIPTIETPGSRNKKRLNKLLVASIVVAVLIAIACVIHVFYRPLDVLYFQFIRVLAA